MSQARCPSTLHFVVTDDGIEVKCSSKRCGAGRGVVIMHYFSPETGKLLSTRMFREPPTPVRVRRGE